MTNKQFLFIPAALFLFISGLYLGYAQGAKDTNNGANKRAVQMILNDEIPNYYLVVGTLDYLINNKSGKLEKLLKENQGSLKKNTNLDTVNSTKYQIK